MHSDLFEKIDDRSVESGEYLPIVEEFYSIQGEGYHAGKPAYFIRIGGCDIACHFCDTKISWNPRIHKLASVDEIVAKVLATPARSVVVTGGEPTMYNLEKLTQKIRANNIESFLETSGAYPITGKWNWVCISPKKQKFPLLDNMHRADELKVVISSQEDFQWAERWKEKVHIHCKLFIQPEFSHFDNIIAPMVEFAQNNPVWNISLQIHKFMKIP